MLERQLELEGGLTLCPLGALRPAGGQTLECALRLEAVRPGRRVILWVEADEGGQPAAFRTVVLPPQPGPEPADVPVTVRLYFDGDGPRALTLRADAHYLDPAGRCLLPE